MTVFFGHHAEYIFVLRFHADPFAATCPCWMKHPQWIYVQEELL